MLLDFFTFYYMGNELAMAIKHYPILLLILIIHQWQKSGIFSLFAVTFAELVIESLHLVPSKLTFEYAVLRSTRILPI